MAYEKRDTSYPSPSEVKLFIGPNWVDDAYRIDYTVSTQRIPLYDYTSKFFKDVAEGNTIVQGQLIINYRFPHYLHHAIKDTLQRYPEVKDSFNEAGNLFRELAEGTAEDKVRNLISLQKKGNLKAAKTLAPILNGDTTTISQEFKETPVISQQSIIPFDIVIRYNGDNKGNSHKIEHVVLLGESQVLSAAALAGGDLSASSMPIYEVYSFFAKRIVPIIER